MNWVLNEELAVGTAPQKQRHLEKLANKILKDEERRDNLRAKNIKGDFLNKF